MTALRTFTKSNTVGGAEAPCGTLKFTERAFPEKQTVAFNIKARVDFKTKKRARMSVWEAIELLNTLIDESDPDVSCRVDGYHQRSLMTSNLQTSISQIDHLLQTAEAIRADGKPEWMQVCS